MARAGQGRALLVSLAFHLVIVAVLATKAGFQESGSLIPGAEVPVLPKGERVFLPPPGVLRELAPRPVPATPPPASPAPQATPVPPAAKDRVSIGSPEDAGRRERLLLRPDEDLTAKPGAGASPAPRSTPTPLPEPSPAADRSGAERETAATDPRTAADPRAGGGLPLPPGGRRREPPPRDAAGGATGRPGSLAESLRKIERLLPPPGAFDKGSGRRMGPLFFDPEGADFTAWVNHFKNEAYRNWLVPESALLGFRGHVDIDFNVERDGSMTNLRLVKSSGTPSLDRAAVNALRGSRLLPLPADYAPPRITMQVSFFYNEEPQG